MIQNHNQESLSKVTALVYIEYCGTIFAVGLRPSLTHHALSTIGQTNISSIFRGLWVGLLMPYSDRSG